LLRDDGNAVGFRIIAEAGHRTCAHTSHCDLDEVAVFEFHGKILRRDSGLHHHSIAALIGSVLCIQAMQSNLAQSAEVRAWAVQTGSGRPTSVLSLEGVIERGDLEKIQRKANDSIILKIFVSSPGGNVDEAIKIADYVNTKFISVVAPLKRSNGTLCNPYDPPNKLCTCDSACAIVWLLAPSRGGNVIGIHRPRFDYDDYAGLSLEQAKLSYNRMLDGLTAKLKEDRVDQSIIERMMRTPSRSMYYLTKKEIELIGYYAPYIDELLIAKCKDYIYDEQQIETDDAEFEKAIEMGSCQVDEWSEMSAQEQSR
jgi:hypothetical protein